MLMKNSLEEHLYSTLEDLLVTARVGEAAVKGFRICFNSKCDVWRDLYRWTDRLMDGYMPAVDAINKRIVVANPLDKLSPKKRTLAQKLQSHYTQLEELEIKEKRLWNDWLWVHEDCRKVMRMWEKLGRFVDTMESTGYKTPLLDTKLTGPINSVTGWESRQRIDQNANALARVVQEFRGVFNEHELEKTEPEFESLFSDYGVKLMCRLSTYMMYYKLQPVGNDELTRAYELGKGLFPKRTPNQP